MFLLSLLFAAVKSYALHPAHQEKSWPNRTIGGFLLTHRIPRMIALIAAKGRCASFRIASWEDQIKKTTFLVVF